MKLCFTAILCFNISVFHIENSGCVCDMSSSFPGPDICVRLTGLVVDIH